MKNRLYMLVFGVLMAALLPLSAAPTWEINSKGAIQWTVDKPQLPHYDHIEMSGEQIAFVLRWGVDADGELGLERSLVFPMLRTSRGGPTTGGTITNKGSWR